MLLSRLQHPFSPKGKLIHFGLLALEQSNYLVQVATKHQPSCLIQPHLYRIALNEANVKQLQETATNYPELATWMSKEEIDSQLGSNSMGGLKLSNGCQVIHVPVYLKALWEACKAKAEEYNGEINWEQRQITGETQLREKDHDAIIFAAGAGILQDKLLCENENSRLPVQLIRGQSIVMAMPEARDDIPKNEALLCGKYIAPIPCSTPDDQQHQSKAKGRRFNIGATHEFKSTKLDEAGVINELKQRSYQLAPALFDNGIVDKLTSGIRMQSNRGRYGRMPIIGRLDSLKEDNQNSWIFTGLSSRGLIYHGLFGRWLAEAVLHNDEQILSTHFEEFDWWKQKY